MPHCLHLHPDTPRPRPGTAARPPYAARFLARTHFIACQQEAPDNFVPFEVLTLKDLESWFPDRSGILSQLPRAWTVQSVADLAETTPLQLFWPQLPKSESVPARAAWQHLRASACNEGPAKAHPGMPARTSGEGLATLCCSSPGTERFRRFAAARQHVSGRPQWLHRPAG